MIDIHSHILFGVDDGASNIDESIKMVSEAEKLGIKVIIATPHFHEEVFDAYRVREKYDELLEKTKQYNVCILLGYEVYLKPVTIPQIYSNSLNIIGSRYVLIELPFEIIPPNINETIYQLQLRGIKPILAHPERNKNLNRNIQKLIKLIELGCLVQVDSASILGVYGIHIKAFTKLILKLQLAHFVASDAHCSKDYKQWYSKAYRKVYKWTNEEYTHRVFNSNALDIITRHNMSPTTGTDLGISDGDHITGLVETVC